MKIKIIAYSINIILGILLSCIMSHCKPSVNKDSKNENSYKESYESKKPKSENSIYQYKLTIKNAAHELEISNYQRINWRGENPLKLTSSQIKALNGVYEWQSTIAFKTQREMFDYICEHFYEMQKFKVESAPVARKPDKSSKNTNIYDEYQDRFDDYLDDPEDEIEFDPEVFDFQDD